MSRLSLLIVTVILAGMLFVLPLSSNASVETIEQQILKLEQDNQILRTTKKSNETLLKNLSTQQQQEFRNSDYFLVQLRERFKKIHQLASTLTVTQLQPGRLKLFSDMSQIPVLPSAGKLEQAIQQLQSLITDTAIRDTVHSSVVQPNGSEIIQPVTYVGPFAAISKGNFLIYQPALDRLLTAPYQPNIIARLQADDFVASGHLTLPIDPGHGALLSALSRQSSLWSKIESSGFSGWLILALGGFGILLTALRLSFLQKERHRIKWQRAHQDSLSSNNSFGRILLYLQTEGCSDQANPLHIHQAVRSEQRKLRTGLETIRFLIVLNPLLGLLATSTGIIKTLQTTNSGIEQEQFIAAGAAQAIVPFVFGLATAIPLLLCYAQLSSRSQRLLRSLEKVVTEKQARSREKRSSFQFKKTTHSAV